MNRARAIPYFLYPIFVLGIFLGITVAAVSTRAAAGANGISGSSFELNGAPMEVCVADTANMIAYWPFDESAGATTFYDAIGTNNGTCIGPDGCPAAVSGEVGGAFSFDGTDDEVNVPDFAALDWGNSTSFSIETWVKIPSGEPCTQNKVFAGRRGVGVSIWLGCHATGNTAHFAVRDSTQPIPIAFTVFGNKTINDGAWHHVVGVRNEAENKLQIYVDGELEGTTESAIFTGNFASNQALTFGYLNEFPFYHLNGALDELALYNRALTLVEVQAHYYEGAGQSYCNDAPTVKNPGDQSDTEGDSVSLPINASDPDYGDTLTYSVSPGLPPGLTINTGTGLISGTLANNASNSSPYTITVTVTDSQSLTGSTTFNWVVSDLGVNNKPDVDNPGDQTSKEGDDVVLPIEATDPDGDDMTYDASGLPAGLSIDTGTGVISGTISTGAAALSPYSVTVTVTDDGTPQQNSFVSFQWIVTIDLEGSPVVTNPGNQTNKETDFVSLQIVATDPDADPLTYSASGLPGGLSIDESTGLISGTLPVGSAGDYTVTVSVTDGDPGHEVTVQFNWKVTPLIYHVYLPIILK